MEYLIENTNHRRLKYTFVKFDGFSGTLTRSVMTGELLRFNRLFPIVMHYLSIEEMLKHNPNLRVLFKHEYITDDLLLEYLPELFI